MSRRATPTARPEQSAHEIMKATTASTRTEASTPVGANGSLEPAGANGTHLAAVLAALVEMPGRFAELERRVSELAREVAAMRKALPPRMYSPRAAAEVLGVSLSTVHRRVKDGSLPAVSIGRLIKVDLSHLRPMAEVAEEARARASGEMQSPPPNKKRW